MNNSFHLCNVKNEHMEKTVLFKEIVKTISKPIYIGKNSNTTNSKQNASLQNKWVLPLKVASFLLAYLLLIILAYKSQSVHLETLLVVGFIVTLIATITLLTNSNN